MNKSTVTNAHTFACITYALPPRVAVIAAARQQLHDFDKDTYLDRFSKQVTVSNGRYHFEDWNTPVTVTEAQETTPTPRTIVQESYSVSIATLRPEDLINAFWAELETLDPDAAHAILADFDPIQLATDEEQRGYLLESLYEALDACAGEGFYFGSHPGDGADIGFWQTEAD